MELAHQRSEGILADVRLLGSGDVRAEEIKMLTGDGGRRRACGDEVRKVYDGCRELMRCAVNTRTEWEKVRRHGPLFHVMTVQAIVENSGQSPLQLPPLLNILKLFFSIIRGRRLSTPQRNPEYSNSKSTKRRGRANAVSPWSVSLPRRLKVNVNLLTRENAGTAN